MMKKMAWLGMTGLALAGAQAEVISFESLLREMTDREVLTRLPETPYTCRQFSSYDRASVSPEKKETWFANKDYGQYLRVETNGERQEAVLMDATGPGAVVRVWATWNKPTANIVRFYFDDQPTPAIEGPVGEILSGGSLAGPPLSDSVSQLTPYHNRGHNLYLPIPYAGRCKITLEMPAPGAFYYQINYRTYGEGTEVRTFAASDPVTHAAALARAQRALLHSGEAGGESLTTLAPGRIEPGQAATAAIKGPGAVREITIVLAAADHDQALRSTVLEMAFDGQRTVWCPVGDFFGTGHRLSPFRTWYTAVGRDGAMICYWVMPFRESCEISLRNVGTQPVDVVIGDIRHAERPWDERSMHFHAAWRQLTGVRTKTNQGATHGAFDVNYVTVTGQGLYVGDTLTLFNGVPRWWGEGDEKIYVDGEGFPSHFGTGTEDYYGYAWCHQNVFEAPFHAQPRGDGNKTPGMSVNSRYRALDAIPFQASIRVDMELWHWQETPMNYAPATFWYARPGASCNLEPDAETAALPVPKSVEDINPPPPPKEETPAPALPAPAPSAPKDTETPAPAPPATQNVAPPNQASTQKPSVTN